MILFKLISQKLDTRGEKYQLITANKKIFGKFAIEINFKCYVFNSMKRML